MSGSIKEVKAFVAGDIEGDAFGNVTMQFSVEALREFMAMLNMNSVRDRNGDRLTFAVQQYSPGEATFEVTSHRD